MVARAVFAFVGTYLRAFSFFLALTYLKVTWQIISKLFVCDSYMRIGRGRSGAEPGWVFII